MFTISFSGYYNTLRPRSCFKNSRKWQHRLSNLEIMWSSSRYPAQRLLHANFVSVSWPLQIQWIEAHSDTNCSREYTIDFARLLSVETIDLHCSKSSCQTASHSKGNIVSNNNKAIVDLDKCQKIEYVTVKCSSNLKGISLRYSCVIYNGWF